MDQIQNDFFYLQEFLRSAEAFKIKGIVDALNPHQSKVKVSFIIFSCRETRISSILRGGGGGGDVVPSFFELGYDKIFPRFSFDMLRVIGYE